MQMFPNYNAASSTSQAFVFTYTILSTQADPNGISVDAGSINLNGGSIKGGAGNNAALTYTQVTDNASYLVDNTAPTVTLTTGTGVNTGNAMVQSSEAGTAYLVKTGAVTRCSTWPAS